MATITGPLLSTEAIGTLGRALTIARRKSSFTAYRYTPAPYRRTPAQVGRRIMFSFLGSQWPLLPQPDQATWKPNFHTDPPYAFLNYQHVNLLRWSQHNAPSTTCPATQATTPAQIDSFSATPMPGMVSLIFRQFACADCWAQVLYRHHAWPFTPAPTNLVQVFPYVGSGFLQRMDSPVPTGTWHYYLGNFTKTGKLLIWTKLQNVVVP
jgi:hypothetical protein